jgi:hypothetical protein
MGGGVFPLSEASGQRQQQYLEIQPERPVTQIIKVMLSPLINGGCATPAIDLRPPGNSCIESMAQVVVRDLLLKSLDPIRLFWPGADQAHFTSQDINQLGQFIQVETPQKFLQ